MCGCFIEKKMGWRHDSSQFFLNFTALSSNILYIYELIAYILPWSAGRSTPNCFTIENCNPYGHREIMISSFSEC